MLAPGTELVLIPEKPVAGGRMLARYDGRVVLVRGAIPGERVRARIERVSRAVALGAAVDILEPHADRRQPPVDPACGGNAFAHITYARQLGLKAEIVADAFARLARRAVEQPIAVAPSPEQGYRMRARFHVRGGQAGFYREGTHDLCDPATSGQLQPDAGRVAQTVARVLHEGGVSSGAVLGIELAENIDADARAVHVALRDADPAGRLTGLGHLDGLTGVSWSASSDPRTHVIAGIPYVVDSFDARPQASEATAWPSQRFDEPGPPAQTVDDGSTERTVDLSPSPGEPRRSLKNGVGPIRLRRHARAFFQGNRYLLSDLVARVLSLVPEGPVVDLYAGVGLFAVALASTRSDEVVAVEGGAISAADLAANSASCGRPFASHHLSVEDFLKPSRDLRSHSVVVDPPRTGLSRDVARGIQRHRPRRLVYISCDVATLARDVKGFLEADYRLAHLEAFDLFPNTAHVETIAVLDRR